jgi:ABC-type Na+ efflux pump permease subunit
VNWHHVLTIVATNLKRLYKSRDYWIPLTILASLFFVFIPLILLVLLSNSPTTPVLTQIGEVIGTLPDQVQNNIRGDSPGTRTAYAFAVYLLAPVAIIVPLTISSAVGANTIVGERERGTGEFLAHSPLTEQEIYIGKLIGSLIPGYLATVVGFALYSLIVNLVVGPQIGGWFFPTAGWWILIFWVVPPFIAMALSVVLRMSARVRSAAAAQQASTLVTLPIILLSYAVSTGLVYSQAASAFVVGLVAWILAYVGLRSGMKAVKRERLLGVASEA